MAVSALRANSTLFPTLEKGYPPPPLNGKNTLSSFLRVLLVILVSRDNTFSFTVFVFVFAFVDQISVTVTISVMWCGGGVSCGSHE